MKATGILRRIDELGRVVIPKEIRKSMKMREGEELEIYTTDEEVVLKKYSEMSSLSRFAASLASAVNRVTGKGALIVDTDKVIASAGKGLPEEGAPLSEELAKVICARRKVTLAEHKCIKIGTAEARTETIHPILSAGDLFGAVIILSAEPFMKSDEQLAATCANFFEQQIDR